MSAVDSINYWLFAVSRRDRDGSANSLLEHLTEDGFAIVKLPARDAAGEWPVDDRRGIGYDSAWREIWYGFTVFKPQHALNVGAGLIAAALHAGAQS